MKARRIFLVITLLLTACGDSGIRLQPDEASYIGELIFQNECAGRKDCLTAWNRGEEFASLGIGHFIWYPKGREGPFEESFPWLIHYMIGRGVRLPDWLDADMDLPWQTRAEFMAEQKTRKMIEFRNFLAKTRQYQAEFMAKRIKSALPKILRAVPEESRERIRKQFYRMASAPMGMYALMDYVNFKGEGINPAERYQGRGWGLLQVLRRMAETPDRKAARAFSDAASDILEQRVRLAPVNRHEERWLAGWKKRIRTYASDAKDSRLESYKN